MFKRARNDKNPVQLEGLAQAKIIKIGDFILAS